MSAEPDQAVIHVTVEGRSARPGATATQAIERCEALTNAVRAVAHGTVEVPSVSARQERWWQGDNVRVDGDWVASRRGTIIVDVNRVTDVVSHLVANQIAVGEVRWDVKDRSAMNRRARMTVTAPW